jgi:hypothetical protein
MMTSFLEPCSLSVEPLRLQRACRRGGAGCRHEATAIDADLAARSERERSGPTRATRSWVTVPVTS